MMSISLIVVAVVALVFAGFSMWYWRHWWFGRAAVAAAAEVTDPATGAIITPAVTAVTAKRAHWWMVLIGVVFLGACYGAWSYLRNVSSAPAASAPIQRPGQPSVPGAPGTPAAPVYPAPNVPATELHEKTYGDYYSERASGTPARVLAEAKKLREENERLRREVERKAGAEMPTPAAPAAPRRASIPGMGTHGLVSWQSARYVSGGTTAYSADQGGYRRPLGREIAYAEGHRGPAYEKVGEWRLAEDGETVQVIYTDVNGRENRFSTTYSLEEFLAKFVGRRT